MLVVLSSLVVLSVSCTPNKQDNRSKLRLIAEPYAFDFVQWEAQALTSALKGKDSTTEEAALRRQIASVLVDEDICISPPLAFKLEEPPHLLVISPREKIVYLNRILLRQDMSLEEMEKLEAQADTLGLSTLVAELGGFGGTYPPTVAASLSRVDTIDAAVEEWFHQYLALRPLGFLYLLDSIGVRPDPDIVTINETLAGIVSKEIGAEISARYYPGQEKVKTDHNASDFDFDAEMEQTRKQVDNYLSESKIAKAERYMEERRVMFVANGYKIRKLNQAYFAFHGIYGQDPTSVSLIYDDLKKLRDRSPSLKAFIANVANMTSYDKLTRASGK
jgi:hypothetical protein